MQPISIHAPTRGATVNGGLYDCELTLFQSTLLQEERHPLQTFRHKATYFNPRSYKRSDIQKPLFYRLAIISIHAPTRGATWFKLWFIFTVILFQSTLLQEERQPLLIHPACHCLFQSTLLQAERRIFSCHLQPARQISIHAPTRGATVCIHITSAHSCISIHAATRGATEAAYSVSEAYQFQSTLLQEERLQVAALNLNPLSFQSTLLQEERRVWRTNYIVSSLFQSTLLQEERHS